MTFKPTPHQRLLCLMADIAFPLPPKRTEPIIVGEQLGASRIIPLKIPDSGPLGLLHLQHDVAVIQQPPTIVRAEAIKRSKRSDSAQKRRVQKQRARLSGKRK
jgi:hypothetical protein